MPHQRPAGGTGRDRSPSPSRVMMPTVNYPIPRPNACPLHKAWGTYSLYPSVQVQSPICTCSAGLPTRALWSKVKLDRHSLTWFGWVWTEKGEVQRGKLTVLLGKVRGSFIGKGALELGHCRMHRSQWLCLQNMEPRR